MEKTATEKNLGTRIQELKKKFGYKMELEQKLDFISSTINDNSTMLKIVSFLDKFYDNTDPRSSIFSLEVMNSIKNIACTIVTERNPSIRNATLGSFITAVERAGDEGIMDITSQQHSILGMSSLVRELKAKKFDTESMIDICGNVTLTLEKCTLDKTAHSFALFLHNALPLFPELHANDKSNCYTAIIRTLAEIQKDAQLGIRLRESHDAST